jgi:hypothetical protein
LKTEQRCDQEDVTRTAPHHIGGENARQLRYGDDVQREHLCGLLQRSLNELAIQARSGVVHKNIDGYSVRVHSLLERRGGPRSGQMEPFTMTLTACSRRSRAAS